MAKWRIAQQMNDFTCQTRNKNEIAMQTPSNKYKQT